MMNVGQAIRLCRTRSGASQTDVARRASCSLSYLSVLENNTRDHTLSTLTRIAQALHIPIGLLFVFAAEEEDMGPVDSDLTGALTKSALASLGGSTGSTHAEGHRG
ncbi:hypothetical protein LMG28138_04870 [Pararobbsia alpina]|uniref:HTH cro/C1-type domain-containing protein n=2 Tax=Pararobbsia alpina TaxID=621374 RepID=A0A6S7BHI6_9BURK|nr:hypothetical protein LMG28138_04870 [Pararobbsia alpina]